MIIMIIPKVPPGMKKAPIMPPMMIKYLSPQNPFCIPARGSLDVFTPIMITAMSVKNRVTMKQSLQTKRKKT